MEKVITDCKQGSANLKLGTTFVSTANHFWNRLKRDRAKRKDRLNKHALLLYNSR